MVIKVHDGIAGGAQAYTFLHQVFGTAPQKAEAQVAIAYGIDGVGYITVAGAAFGAVVYPQFHHALNVAAGNGILVAANPVAFQVAFGFYQKTIGIVGKAVAHTAVSYAFFGQARFIKYKSINPRLIAQLPGGKGIGVGKNSAVAVRIAHFGNVAAGHITIIHHGILRPQVNYRFNAGPAAAKRLRHRHRLQRRKSHQ